MTVPVATPPEPRADVDFASLGWNVNCTEHSTFVIAKCTGGHSAKWGPEHYDPVTDSGEILIPKKYDGLSPIYPSCTSLNYGTTVWEGIKAFRAVDGTVRIFRPEVLTY